MVLDINGVEINVGDEVIISEYGKCIKAKITKETKGRIHYTTWDYLTRNYRDHSWYGNKSNLLLSNMYKI